MKGKKQSWCKGLTKETDERLRRAGIRISITKKGKRPSKETRKKMSANYNYEAHQLAWTKERRENQSNLTREKNKILWADSSHKEKRSNAISKALTGRKNGPRSAEFKKTLSEKLTGRSYGKGVKHNLKEVTCPYCNKIGKGPNMTRYHFDKCKEK